MPVGRSSWRATFYVHPRTGVLCECPGKSYGARSREKVQQEAEATARARRRIVSDATQLHKVNGVWYEVTLGAVEFAEHPNPDGSITRYSVSFDRLLKAQASAANESQRYDLYGKRDFYAGEKRVLSKKQKKAYGV